MSVKKPRPSAKQVRAFRSRSVGVESIVFANSYAQARHITVKSANDASYPIDYADVVVHRAPEYDCRLTIDGRVPALGICHSPDSLRSRKVQERKVVSILPARQAKAKQVEAEIVRRIRMAAKKLPF